MNIFEKMSQATDRINKVAKNLKVGVGQSQYKAVGEADVLEAVKPIEFELGIYSYPLSRKIVDSNIFTTTSEYKGETKERNTLFLRLETVYRFVNVEKPEEYIDIYTYGDGMDAQDKAPGKAMTYSDKYALLKAYKIETGDDPDQKASEPVSKGSQYRQKDDPPEAIAEAGAIIKRPINSIEHESILAELQRTGIKESQMTKLYKVEKLTDLTFGQFREMMEKFEKTPTKKPVNLGL